MRGNIHLQTVISQEFDVFAMIMCSSTPVIRIKKNYSKNHGSKKHYQTLQKLTSNSSLGALEEIRIVSCHYLKLIVWCHVLVSFFVLAIRDVLLKILSKTIIFVWKVTKLILLIDLGLFSRVYLRTSKKGLIRWENYEHLNAF